MYDSHNDDPGYDTFDEASAYEYDVYDDYDEEYEDEYYEDEFYEEEPVYADYTFNEHGVGEYPSGIIRIDHYEEPVAPHYEDEEVDFYAQERFWTRRRILIALIVVLMVLSLLAPQILQFIQFANDSNSFLPTGPTPTALPSV